MNDFDIFVYSFSESTTDIHKHVGLRPGTHLKATDVGLTGPAGRRISVQLSHQNRESQTKYALPFKIDLCSNIL